MDLSCYGDNESRDRTIDNVRATGPIVRAERMQGKGHVVGRVIVSSGPTSMLTRIATRPTTRPRLLVWSSGCSTSSSTWWSARADRRSSLPIAAAVAWAVRCSPACWPSSSTAASRNRVQPILSAGFVIQRNIAHGVPRRRRQSMPLIKTQPPRAAPPFLGRSINPPHAY